MDIKSIRLQNFKGFKDATLKLKPLTVLLGPNSSGKSSFGQALVALSKSNASKGMPSLAFDNNSSVEFGGYSDLVHYSGDGNLVVIDLGLSSGIVSFGFGKGNKKAGINELDLEYEKIEENNTSDASQVIPIPTPDTIKSGTIKELNRITKMEWSVRSSGSDTDNRYLFSIDGFIINSASDVTGTVIPVESAVPGYKLKSIHLTSLLRNISYLRPDRLKPQRSRDIKLSETASIDDWGDGTDWFIHKNKDAKVDVFFFPSPSVDKEESKKILSEYSQLESCEMEFLPALTKWFDELGLASFLNVKTLDGERTIQLVATPRGQEHARPLTDVGFGLSQVLPILAKGLSLEKTGILVVEQPEAQLHPKPQAMLADFFCSMVKCTRNVIVETHSVELFHRLRLRASMDNNLADKIAVYFLNEPKNGVCCEPIPVPLIEEDELDWPKGFLPEGIKTEMEIIAARLAQIKKD